MNVRLERMKFATATKAQLGLGNLRGKDDLNLDIAPLKTETNSKYVFLDLV